nr:MAG TPA: hypothetical protein [Bacteriophage sp.]
MTLCYLTYANFNYIILIILIIFHSWVFRIRFIIRMSNN